MTDDIRIEAEGSWIITVNGVEVASSGEAPVPPDPPDDTWPDPIDPASFWATEITDPADPATNGGKRSGCRRIGVDAGVTVPEGFELWATSSQFSGGDVTGATLLPPGTDKTYQNAVASGEKRYQLAWWKKVETGEFRGALPATGQSGTNAGKVASQPLSSNPNEPDRGQVVLTIQGLNGGQPVPEPGKWPAMPQSSVDTALSMPVIKYGNKGNSNCNYGAKGTALLATVYAWMTGDRRQTVKDNIMAILGALTDPGKGPCGMNGPGAAQEAYALAWFHLLRKTDLWGNVSDTQKKRIDAIFHALALIRAWEGNDGSKSGGAWTITGMTGTDFKGIGPNISGSIPGQLVLCAEWFGYSELVAWLDQATVGAVRNEVKAAFGGTGGTLYLTLNWKNAGISAADEGAYYRSGPSSDAPTDAQVESSIRNLRYYGAPITDLPLFLFPNDSRSLNKTMPPTKRTAGGNKWVGYNQPAVNNGAGMMVDGKKRGYVLKDPMEMPWYGQEGSMIYELNGQDEGGIRSCMGYAWWTAYLTNCQLLPVVLNANPAIGDSRVVDFMGRWGKAYDIVKFFDDKDYNSIAHATTKKNGGPGCIKWSDCRDDWYPEINFFLWDAIVKVANG